MNCEEIRERITPFLLGDLDTSAEAEIGSHLETCGGCRAYMREIEPTLDLLRDALAAPPPNAPARLSAAGRAKMMAVLAGAGREKVRRAAETAGRNKILEWLGTQHVSLVAVAAVLVLCGLLAAMMLPAISGARERASKANDMASLSRIGKSVIMYEMEYGKRPEGLDDLKEAGLVDNDKLLKSTATGERFEYYGRKTDEKTASDHPIALGRTSEGANVLYSDGQVAWVSKEKLEKDVLPKLPNKPVEWSLGGAAPAGPDMSDEIDMKALGLESGASRSGPAARPVPEPEPVEELEELADFDDVAIVKSPVIMRGIYGSRSPGSRGSAVSSRQTESPAAAHAAPPPESAVPESGDEYTIASGDTLSTIAERHGVTVHDIAEANGIRDVDRIRAGEKLRMPDRAALVGDSDGDGFVNLSEWEGKAADKPMRPSTELRTDRTLSLTAPEGELERRADVPDEPADLGRIVGGVVEPSGVRSHRRGEEDESSQSRDGIPMLGRIPLGGRLFEDTEEEKEGEDIPQPEWKHFGSTYSLGGQADRDSAETRRRADNWEVKDYSSRSPGHDGRSKPVTVNPDLYVSAPEVDSYLNGVKGQAEAGGRGGEAVGFAPMNGTSMAAPSGQSAAESRTEHERSAVIAGKSSERRKEDRSKMEEEQQARGAFELQFGEPMTPEEKEIQATFDSEAARPAAGDASVREENAVEKSLLKRLEETVIPDLDFRNADIHAIVDFLEEQNRAFGVSGEENKRTPVNIELDLSDGDKQADRIPPITFKAGHITVKEALDVVSRMGGLEYRVEGNLLKLSPVAAPAGGKVRAEDPTGPRFAAVGVNPFYHASDRPFSTFAIDVDTASYTLARNYMLKGLLPPAESVRTEEFVNFFDYAYKAPERETFRVYAECAPSRFGRGLYLLKVGVKGRRIGREQRRNSVLTFLVDSSGSMNTPDRIGLVRKSLKMLVSKLDPNDRVAIIQFGSEARIVLPHTRAAEKTGILDAIDRLQTTGSTNLEEGMKLAYQVAGRAYKGGASNRVLIMSDGAANLGTDTAEDMLAHVERHRKQGVFCSVFGFGIGTYNDEMLEKLANKGDGTYCFIDSVDEAERVFVDDLSAVLNTIASDVKIQVEFNPDRVDRYRQMGYENRQLKKEQFRDDTVDAGEVGSGQAVTALYELDFKRAMPAQTADAGPVATVRVRYRRTDTGEVEEIERAVRDGDIVPDFELADTRFRLAAAVAEFAEILRGCPHAAGSTYEDVARALRPVALELNLDRRVGELARMVSSANGMARGE